MHYRTLKIICQRAAIKEKIIFLIYFVAKSEALRLRYRKANKMAHDILTSTFMTLRQKLVRGAGRIVGADEADDILQDAFVRLWSRRDEITDRRHAEGLASVTVRNISIDRFRERGHRLTEELDGKEAVEETDDTATLEETYSEVTAIIDSRLSERDRRIMYMRDRDGVGFDIIAAEFGLSEANVRMIVSRARTTIRNIYLSTQNKTQL